MKLFASLLTVTAVFAIAGSAFAKTEVARTAGYVYYKTPLNEMLPKERRVVVQRSLELVASALRKSISQAGYISAAADPIRKLEVANVELDSVLKAATEYANGTKYFGFGGWNLVPSAILVQFGGKIALNMGPGGSGSVGAGIILMPTRIDRVDLLTQEITTSYRMEFGFVGFGSGNIGGGVGGGGALRAGVGFIWGPLESPNDFKGLALGMSGDATLGPVGLNVKGGLLKQWGKAMFLNQRINPYAVVSWQGGVAAEANIHGNITPVINLSGPLSRMLEEALGTEFSKEFEVKDFRKKI